MREVWEANIRLNKTKPEVFITKKPRGGILLGKTVPLDIDDETLRNILREFRIMNADVLIRSVIDVDDFIDCIESNRKYLPAIICLNKIDLATAEKGINIETLKELIFQKLDFMRVYLKEPRKEADLKEPLIMKRNSTIETVCNKLHKDFSKKFKFARVWGASTRFPGQKLMLGHVLRDRDILEIHL